MSLRISLEGAASFFPKVIKVVAVTRFGVFTVGGLTIGFFSDESGLLAKDRSVVTVARLGVFFSPVCWRVVLTDFKRESTLGCCVLLLVVVVAVDAGVFWGVAGHFVTLPKRLKKNFTEFEIQQP